MRRRLVLSVVATASVLVSAACGGGDDDDAAPRYDDLASLAAELDDVEAGCTLEYEGLEDGQRELSVCTMGDAIAELSVWTDADALSALVQSAEESGETIVFGPNWTIGIGDAAIAGQIADATGGNLSG